MSESVGNRLLDDIEGVDRGAVKVTQTFGRVKMYIGAAIAAFFGFMFLFIFLAGTPHLIDDPKNPGKQIPDPSNKKVVHPAPLLGIAIFTFGISAALIFLSRNNTIAGMYGLSSEIGMAKRLL